MPDYDTNFTKQLSCSRIDWIDLAKGMAIFLVIVGHTVTIGWGSVLRGVIFSFHMPLFFILSAMTFRASRSLDEFAVKSRRAALHLLIPALGVFAVCLLYDLFRTPKLFTELWFLRERFYTFLFASGVKTTFAGVNVPAMGIPWFFFALFIGRSVFDYLQRCYSGHQLFIMSVVVSFIGITLGAHLWLPFSADIALACMLFFYVGAKMHSNIETLLEKRPGKTALISLAAWIFTLACTFPFPGNWSYLELACRRYPLFPISYISACAGTLFIASLSCLLLKYTRQWMSPLVYIGRNSMWLLIIHCLDGFFYKYWVVEGRQFWTSAKRLLCDLLVFYIVAFVLELWKKRNNGSSVI